jgi:ADP-ribose pyrophosphatase YjhB (NUDIX family)
VARLVYGDRIGKLGRIRLGCSAMIFDAAGRLLLTRRTDNGQWCLPGGGIDPGESVTEACAREVQEETGLIVRVGRLVGVYSDPHMLLEYADGNRFHLVALSFAAEVVGGTLGLSEETSEVGYFPLDEVKQMDLMEHHRIRIRDAIANQAAAFTR